MGDTPRVDMWNDAPVAVDVVAMPTTQWIHLTARMSPAAPDLSRQETGEWLWTALRHAFPDVLAAVLMPDHPHLVLASRDAEADRQRLARLLGHFGRRFGVWGRVSKVPSPVSIREGDVLARQIRYVLLNPCRAKRVGCPLSWVWTTHRDVLGAAIDPWVTADRLAMALGMRARSFAAHHHAYVSGDPHARIEGTPLPVPVARTAMPTFGLRTIAEAVAAATRTQLGSMRTSAHCRSLFVALALDQGWGQIAQLAEVCGCCPRTIRNAAKRRDVASLEAARLCLGDERLRRSAPPLDARKPRGTERLGPLSLP